MKILKVFEYPQKRHDSIPLKYKLIDTKKEMWQKKKKEMWQKKKQIKSSINILRNINSRISECTNNSE